MAQYTELSIPCLQVDGSYIHVLSELLAYPNYALVWDDEHCWSEDGDLNIECRVS
jgi:hypothetical protein